MKIEAVKTSDGYFITERDMKTYNNTLERVVFNRVLPEKTWKQGWFKIVDIEGKIEKLIPEHKEIEKYQLKEEYEATKKTPKEVDLGFFAEDSYDDPHPLKGLYEPVYKTIPASYEDIEDVEVKVVAELEGKLVEEKINFPVYGRYPNTDGKNWSVKNSELKLGLVDELVTPEILREERPCELSSEHSFKIIRAYIKDNIDPKVAEITSDYDFCLTVEKRIPLCEEQKFVYDDNFVHNLFSKRKRKPKMKVGYKKDRKVKVFETAPLRNGETYRGYTATPPFRGENARNLKKNIDTFLADLMQEINKPLKDCPNCSGLGVIE